MAKRALLASDREFFSLVSRAAFANPFGEERERLDREMAAGVKETDQDLLLSAKAKVTRKLATLDQGGSKKISDFKGGDQPVMESAFLFAIFYRFSHDYDQLIRDQLAASDKPLTVSFGREALDLFRQRGFSTTQAKRYFSLFYQMRRAFHFIDQGLIGCSAAMRRLRMELWNNIFTHNIKDYERFIWDRMEDFSTLLLGPTGSGKGAAAAAIGRSGYIPFDEKKETFTTSFTQTFLPINLQEFPESLLESELFGHTRGAFTGAVKAHDGVFARCQPHGSIFLDEVGEISTRTQVKLLTVLQDRVFTPLGGHERRAFHGRIIAATNQPLSKLRLAGRFRDDFYYRLCSDCIAVPGLQEKIRENPVELTDLVEHTVKRIIGHPSPEITAQALAVINTRLGKDYPWPGNVRELAQCVRRIILKGDYRGDETLTMGAGENRLLTRINQGNMSAQEVLAGYCSHLYQALGSFEKVARVTKLDRRTVKRHILYQQELTTRDHHV